MTFDSLSPVFYTSIFVLPGFIVKSIIDVMTPPQRYNNAKYFLSYLLYSLVNCSLCSWAYILISKHFLPSSGIYWILSLLITVISSILLALLIGFCKQKEWIEKIFARFHFRKIHPSPTAWDYVFSRQEDSWVIVTLKNGSIIYGLYSFSSFASSDTDERDLYIEKVFTIGDNSQWIPNEQSKGILISKDSILTIELLT